MEGLRFHFLEKNGSRRIELNSPQYISMEPFDKIVIRYTFTKDGLEQNTTKITKQVVDPSLLRVKILPTKEKFLSKIIDFKNIPTAPSEAFSIEFEGDSDIVYVDVLYESLTTRRLRVKVGLIGSRDFSFENEHTVSDGPDAYVKLVDVQIKYDAVYYTYVYRRNGRLKKYIGKTGYEELGFIYKDREFNPDTHVDKNFSRYPITEGLKEEGWLFDYENDLIYKINKGRRVEITDTELGKIILAKARIEEILGLLKTEDPAISKHYLRLTAENFLQDCDKICGLGEATPNNTVDLREI